MKSVTIIAEAGVNHNGDMALAKKLIDIASKAKADYVKFQAFKASTLLSENTPKANYQKETTGSGSQFELIKKLELTDENFFELKAYADKKDISFLLSPFDLDSIDLIVELGLDTIKVPSGEIDNFPYLAKIGGLNKKIIVSTGMALIDEIRGCLDVLIDHGTSKHNISILHCNTEYPTPFEDVNLLAMNTLKKTFELPVGYSDHTPGIEVSLAAVASGATIIEKHFTNDKNHDGPDHKASLAPDELSSLVASVRNVEKCLGSFQKTPSASELKNKPLVRKSIVAKTSIQPGEIFSEHNLTTKRPADGINPMRWKEVLGNKAKRAFAMGENIEL